MIVGIEGIHTWDSDFVLNDRSSLPHVRVRSISGLHQSPDFEPINDPSTGRIGEVPRKQTRRGRTIAYEGDVMASTLAELREYEAEFMAAFSGTDEQRMDCEPHPDYMGDDLPSRYFHARALDLSIEDDQTGISPYRVTHGYQRPFSLGVRLSDPRYYWPDATTGFEDASTSPLDGTGTPVTPEGEDEDDADAEGLEVVVENEGNFATEALIVVEGRVWNPIISNETTGKFLRFGKLDLDADDTMTIDTRRRRAERESDGKNIRYKIDANSTWWDRDIPALVPGENIIRLRGFLVGAAATLTVTFHSADIA